MEGCCYGESVSAQSITNLTKCLDFNTLANPANFDIFYFAISRNDPNEVYRRNARSSGTSQC